MLDCDKVIRLLNWLIDNIFTFGDKVFRQVIGIPIKFFRNCGRYIDDLGLINNDGRMKEVMSDIYPKELVLVPDDSDGQSCSFLDLKVVIKDSIITTSIFDKRDAFDFPIVNFPTLSGNIPRRSSYGVFIGELVRYARACTRF